MILDVSSLFGFVVMLFEEFLRDARNKAGFSSLESVVSFAKEEYGEDASLLSKSMLSLYERGETKTVKPDVLRLLAALYGVQYKELAILWFSSRYKVEFATSKQSGFSTQKTKDSCTLKGPTNDARDDIKIINLAELERTQANLPLKTQVGVAATRFLDDGVFFDMVSKNINRGIKYYYLMPDLSLIHI